MLKRSNSNRPLSIVPICTIYRYRSRYLFGTKFCATSGVCSATSGGVVCLNSTRTGDKLMYCPTCFGHRPSSGTSCLCRAGRRALRSASPRRSDELDRMHDLRPQFVHFKQEPAFARCTVLNSGVQSRSWPHLSRRVSPPNNASSSVHCRIRRLSCRATSVAKRKPRG